MKTLADYDTASLADAFEAWGHKRSHAASLLKAFYNSGGKIDLPSLLLGHKLQERITQEIPLRQSKLLQRSQSSDGTIKLLLGMDRGGAVETVLMPTSRAERVAGCVSSQIGCAMGCDFCASTRRGLERDLDAGEIVEQFLHLREQALLGGKRLSTLVFMGMGEPLQNYENVVAAIRRIAGEGMGALGWRQITVSTVGIVPEIDRLAASGLNVNLALSLHAPDDETRQRIVPMNRRYGVQEIVAATRRFFEKTGRITNIEYCMLGGINDSDAHAVRLAELLQGFRTHVNVIPFNAIGSSLTGVIYQRPAPERVARFLAILRDAKVVVHERQQRGDDVNAACGQLRETALAANG